MYKSRRHIVFDVETTGLSVERGHRIIEIGAVEVIEGMMGEEFHSLIRTNRPITGNAGKVHGITSDMLTGQPKPEEVFTSFQHFVANSTLIAHNAAFDIAFLRHELRRLGKELHNRHKCTLKLSRKHYPGLPDYRLETVAKHVLGVELDKTRLHRALDDARLTARILLEMRKK